MTYLVVKAESTKIESPYLNEKEQKTYPLQGIIKSTFIAKLHPLIAGTDDVRK